MAIYGRSGTDSDAGTISDTLRVSIFDPMPEHGWGWRMGGKLCKTGSTSPSVRWVIYDIASNTPDERQGYTSSFSVTNLGSAAGDCIAYVSNIVESLQPDNPVDTSVMLWSGRSYAMGPISLNGTLLHQMAQASSVSYDNENFYNKGISSTTPPNPMNPSSSSIEGAMNVYIEYEPNTAPNTPTGLSPTGTINDLTPTFAATFSDGNSDRGDMMNQIDIELRQVGLTALKWNSTYDATSSEQSGSAMSRAYGGTALVAGTSYEWRVRFSDQFGAWGSWTSWTSFTVNGGGIVNTPTTPTGKQETITPGPFQAVWDHNSGLSTNAAEIRIKSGSTVIRGPFNKAVTVADLGTISFTWAETGFASLEWGKNYTFEIRARDTGSLWSPWSTGKAFSTNAYPSVPSNLSPANGATSSSRPLITFTMTDTDDTTATGLTAEVRIKNAAGTLLFTRTATFDSALNKWKYQVTATDFASTATYKWDARGLDGTLNSAYSAERTFVYGAGPVITTVQLNGVTANGAVLTTNTPTLTWVVSGSTQQSFRVHIYETAYDPSATPIYDSGTVVSGTSSHVIPSGYLHNLTTYEVIITVTNTVPLTADSSGDTFSISFPVVPSVTGFQASPIAVAGDTFGQTSAVLLGWNMPDDPPGNFVEYILTRLPTGSAGPGSQEVELQPDEIIIARISSIDQVTFIDHFPASEQPYEYRLYKVVYQGTDITESAPVSATASVSFGHAIVSSAVDPTSRRVALRINRSTKVDHRGEQSLFFTWGDHAPTIVVSPVHYHVVTGSYLLYDTANQSVSDALATLSEIQDASEIVCYRDERGKKLFGIMNYSEDYAEMRREIITLNITESSFQEGTE